MLVECLTYIAVLGIIFAASYGVFFKAFDSTRSLQRSATDITRVMTAGEQWREDIRSAESVTLTSNSLKISLPAQKIEYQFADGCVYRALGNKPRIRLLADVVESSMIFDPHGEIHAWRWELQMKTRRTESRMKPLFTFQAVTPQKP